MPSASMGPRSIDRGNLTGLVAQIKDWRLQWGRDQLIAEINLEGRSCSGSSGFNGAAIN